MKYGLVRALDAAEGKVMRGVSHDARVLGQQVSRASFQEVVALVFKIWNML